MLPSVFSMYIHVPSLNISGEIVFEIELRQTDGQTGTKAISYGDPKATTFVGQLVNNQEQRLSPKLD